MKKVTQTFFDERILVTKHTALGRITIDHPRAIGALDRSMVEAFAHALEGLAVDTDVDTLLLDATDERGFCSGGDLRRLHGQITAGDLAGVDGFFRAEYRLNAAIAAFPHPVVAFANGVTMGGGVGLACHAPVRIVTETSRLAMPETRIGFTPDVGGTLLLANAPGHVGEYLALTSAEMDAADAIYAGFADHLVRGEDLGAVRDALETRADPSTPGELILLFDETPEPSALASARGWIDDAFSRGSVPEIRARLTELAEQADDGATHDLGAHTPAAALALLEQRPPLALAITLESVRRSRETNDLRAALEQEYRLMMWYVETQPDMVEGIRAHMIDKDRAPRWTLATDAEVTPALVAEAFDHKVTPLFP
ncbi:enoyl-CoA hydratase [Microbacterium nanhaiense]|uniref:3-hydroxyisobutyryl-CoA hydrolase n=1 Tax=Microbacterium nanhaiense TaxID=1301026 RepID=A0ABQ2N0Q5_9MICO|nr:enoyl-CoA hydratase [Microbacterium nanhaiense]